LASGAPPSPFETASGFFSTDRTRRTKVPRDPLLEFGSSTELACFALRPPFAPSPIRPACANRAVPEPCGTASPGVLPPSNTTTSGAPLRQARPCDRSCGRGSPDPRRCRPQGSCPSRRFRLHTRHCTNPCGARRFTVVPRRFAALFHAARVPLEIPSRAFPSRGAVPALAGLRSSLRVRVRLPPARRDRDFHDRFPRRASSLPGGPPGGGPRLMSRDDGFLATARPAAWTHS